MDVVLFGHLDLKYTCVYTGLWDKMHCLLWALVRVLKNTFLAAIEFGISEILLLGFPCGSAGKESACNSGDLGSIPGLGRSPGEGRGYPFQYSGLENSMDYMVHGLAKSQTRLSDFHIHIQILLLSWKMSCFNIWKTECVGCRLELASLKMSYFCLIAWVSEVKVSQSCLTLCDPMGCSLPGSSVHGDFPGKNIGVGCHFLLQGIFPTQGSNLGLLPQRQIFYCLSHQRYIDKTIYLQNFKAILLLIKLVIL